MGKFNARLDRFYTGENIKVRTHEKYDFSGSDHDLYINEIDISHEKRKGKGIWKCNNRVFEMDEFKNELKSLMLQRTVNADFDLHPDTWWVKTKDAIKTLCIKNSRLLKEKENEEKQILEDEVQKFKYDLNSSTSGKKYYEAKKRLQVFFNSKNERQTYKTKIS